MLTLRLSHRTTLVASLAAFALGHVVVAVSSSVAVVLGARFATAVATGAFWAVANVVAARAAGPSLSSRAMGIVGAGAMLANVVGVPLGAFAGQLLGWRGPFWALAVVAALAVVPILRHVAADRPDPGAVSIRTELGALRSGRLWLVLAACATTTGGTLSAYTYIAPLLTERAGVAAGLVPLVLVGFGAGALVGTVLGGRLGDVRPHTVTIAAAAASATVLAAIALLGGLAGPTVVLVTLLGAVGLGANPVLISLAVRYAGAAGTLGSSLSVAAFNTGTAVGSGLAGLALGSALGVTGPAALGAVVAALTLVPVVALALRQRRRPS